MYIRMDDPRRRVAGEWAPKSEKTTGGMMYKPNGEEPMTKNEEQRHRKALAERKAGRSGIERHATFSTMHAAFLQGQASHRETVGASFEPLH